MLASSFLVNVTLAYVGPGLGGGLLAAVAGFLLSLFLAVFAVVWYPLKKLFKGKQKGPQAPPAADGGEPPEHNEEPPSS